MIEIKSLQQRSLPSNSKTPVKEKAHIYVGFFRFTRMMTRRYNAIQIATAISIVSSSRKRTNRLGQYQMYKLARPL